MQTLLTNFLTLTAEYNNFWLLGMTRIAIGICAISMMASALGEGYLCAKAIEGMSRNPEMYSKIRTGMILGAALTETTAIYSLLLAILMLFINPVA